ncbi:MAG TPA: hypothetical protein VIJ22_02355, partial [Polyangiaceae bacterium]
MTRSALCLAFFAAIVSTACETGEGPPPAAPAPAPQPSPAPLANAPPATPPPRLSRADFNRFALRMNAPVFWAADTNGDGVPSRDEVKALLFYPSSAAVDVDRTIASILAFDPGALPAGLPADEVTRRRLVADDLDQGAPSL